MMFDKRSTINLSFIIVVLAVLISGGMFIIPFLGLYIVFGFLVIFQMFISNPILNNSKWNIIFYLIIILIHSIILLHPGESFTHILDKMYIFIISFVFFIGMNNKQEYKDFLYKVLGLVVYNIIASFVLYVVYKGVFQTTEYYNSFIYVFNYVTYDSVIFPRFMGPFFEPGVTQIYLNIYLYLILFEYKKSLLYILLTILSIILTQSTTGYVITGVIILYYLLTDKGLLSSVGLKVAIIVAIIAIYPTINTNMNDKLTSSGNKYGSYESRSVDLQLGLKVLYNNPILGIGFNYDNYYKEAGDFIDNIDTSVISFSNSEFKRGNSNSIIRLFYSLGLILSIPIIYGLYNQSIFKEKKLFFLIMILSLSSESLLFSPFFLYISYSGISKIE